MTNLPYNRLAAFSLGVMTTVLLLAPSAKAYCAGKGLTTNEFLECLNRESRERDQLQRIKTLEDNQRNFERQRQGPCIDPLCRLREY
jgi:hypothetical protein